MMKLILKNLSILIIVLGLLFFMNIPYLKQLLIVIIILVFIFSKSDTIFEGFFNNNLSIKKLLIYSFLIALSFNIFGKYALLPFIEIITKSPINFGSFELIKGNLTLLINSYFIAWIIGGFFEEIIFRGFLINSISNLFPKKVGYIIAIFLSLIIFGYLHSYQGISGQILTGATGLLLSVLYLKFNKNIWLCILTHGFLNTISLTALYFN